MQFHLSIVILTSHWHHYLLYFIIASTSQLSSRTFGVGACTMSQSPSWPSLYNPAVDLIPVAHEAAVQPRGVYLYNVDGKWLDFPFGFSICLPTSSLVIHSILSLLHPWNFWPYWSLILLFCYRLFLFLSRRCSLMLIFSSRVRFLSLLRDIWPVSYGFCIRFQYINTLQLLTLGFSFHY